MRDVICISCCFAVAAALAAQSWEKPAVEPHQGLSAEEVVRIQLDALAENDTPLPNAGVAKVYEFASPRNRRMTGPLDRFTIMANSRPYEDMLDHRDAKIIDVRSISAHTLITVRLTTRDGRERRYVFALNRYTTDKCESCWMTDGVMPVDDNRRDRLI